MDPHHTSDLPRSHQIGAREAIRLRSGLLLRGTIDGGGRAIPAAWLRGVHRLRDVLTPLVDTLPADFITLGQAHKALQRIGLLIQHSQRIGCGACSHHSHCVLLRHWQANMVPLNATLTTPKAKSTAAILQLHAMALGIMSDALVNGDAAFEEATPTFETTVAHTALLLESEDQTQRPSHEINLSFKAGLIGPLYYTAIKRRVLPVRLRALRLLEVAPWREGIWRSGIAARQAGSSRLR